MHTVNGPDPFRPPEQFRSDQELFEWLASHRDQVFRVLRSMRISKADCDDITHLVILRTYLYLRAGKGADIRDLVAWLCRVAIRVALSYLGRERSRVRRLLEIQARLAVVEVERLDEKQDRLDEIKEAVGRLSSEWRDVFTYCRFEGHTIREAAAFFCLPPGVVAGRVTRAIKALRRELGVDSQQDEHQEKSA